MAMMTTLQARGLRKSTGATIGFLGLLVLTSCAAAPFLVPVVFEFAKNLLQTGLSNYGSKHRDNLSNLVNRLSSPYMQGLSPSAMGRPGMPGYDPNNPYGPQGYSPQPGIPGYDPNNPYGPQGYPPQPGMPGYDPNNPYRAAPQNPYGQQANPYGTPAPYGQPGYPSQPGMPPYNPNNPYGAAPQNPYGQQANPYGTPAPYGQQGNPGQPGIPGYDPNNPYRAAPQNPYGQQANPYGTPVPYGQPGNPGQPGMPPYDPNNPYGTPPPNPYGQQANPYGTPAPYGQPGNPGQPGMPPYDPNNPFGSAGTVYPGQQPYPGQPSSPGQQVYPGQAGTYDPNNPSASVGTPYPDPGQQANPGQPQQRKLTEKAQRPTHNSSVPKIKAGTHPRSIPSEPVAVEVALVRQKQTAKGKEVVLMNDGDVLYDGGGKKDAGDKFKLVVRTNCDCYVYIVSIDGSAWAEPVFPTKAGTTPNPVKKDQEMAFPEGPYWFSLDQVKGIETFYVVASMNRRTDLEENIAKLAAETRPVSTIVAKVEEPPVIPRGVGSVKPRGIITVKDDTGTAVQVPSQSYEANQPEQDVTVTRWFKHE
jgi:hypothetical protein